MNLSSGNFFLSNWLHMCELESGVHTEILIEVMHVNKISSVEYQVKRDVGLGESLDHL